MALQAFTAALGFAPASAFVAGPVVAPQASAAPSSLQGALPPQPLRATYVGSLSEKPLPLLAAGTLLAAAAARKQLRRRAAVTVRRAMAGKAAADAAAPRAEAVTREARGGGFDPSTMVGATAPLGYWDPCGFSTGKSEENFLDLRGKELKHGRLAMMCIVGFLGQSAWRFPGYEDVPDGLAALQTYPGSSGFAILFIIIGFFELRFLPDLETEPGNFGDPFKMIPTQSGGYDENWRNFELNNSRLAMFGAIGTIAANGYTGLDAFEQWQNAKPAAIAFIKATLPFAP